MNDAQSKANARYRKANVKSFNVKFFPADAEILGFFQGKANRNQYIKDLIRKDMEAMKAPKNYTFESANKGDIEITISGEYVEGSVDLEATIIDTNAYREWSEVDPGGVDEVFEWLIDQGVDFENDRSLWFNVHYVADVMIDGFCTEAQLLDKAAAMSAEELKKWRDFNFSE